MWFLTWTNARDFFWEIQQMAVPKKRNWFWMVSSYKSGEGTSRWVSLWGHLRIALGNHDISPKSHGSLFPIEFSFWGTGIADFPTSPNITLIAMLLLYMYMHNYLWLYIHMILCMYDTYRSYIEFFVFIMISCLHPILMVITPFSQQETLQTEPFGAVWIVPVSRCPQWVERWTAEDVGNWQHVRLQYVNIYQLTGKSGTYLISYV